MSWDGEARDMAGKGAQQQQDRQDTLRTMLQVRLDRYAKRATGDLDRRLADFTLNDIGNGRRLLHRHGNDLLYVPQLKDEWYVWNGACWEHDKAGLSARRLAQSTALDLFVEARGLMEANDHPARVQEHLDHAERSGSAGRVAAMLSTMAPDVKRDMQDLDSALDCITCKDVTLQLGLPGDPVAVQARAHDRADLATRQATVVWDEDAECPQFKAFLAKVQPDPEIREFLQRWFGLCLSGRVVQHILLFYGLGANGKSTLLNIIRDVLGSYAMTLNFNSLTDDSIRGGGDATPDLARLPGARLVMASEPKVGTQLSESMIKTQTGDEPMAVRPMFKEQFEFLPTHKLVLSFNNKPRVAATDEGTWRRLLMVPWETIIPPQDRETDFARRIGREEGPGILKWLVDGWQLYADTGLNIPASVLAATDEYREENDPVGGFLKTCTDEVGPGEHHSLSAKQLWACWQHYAAENSLDVTNTTRFGKRLSERGYRKEKTGGVILYFGRRFNEVGHHFMGNDTPG